MVPPSRSKLINTGLINTGLINTGLINTGLIATVVPGPGSAGKDR